MSTRESRFFNKLCFLANLQLNNKNLIAELKKELSKQDLSYQGFLKILSC